MVRRDGSRSLNQAHGQLVSSAPNVAFIPTEDLHKKRWPACSRSRDPDTIVSLRIVFSNFKECVCIHFLVCLKKEQKLPGLKQQKFIVSHFWMLKVQNQCVSGAMLPL